MGFPLYNMTDLAKAGVGDVLMGGGIRYGRPPWETLGSKRKGIDGRAHKEWNLRLQGRAATVSSASWMLVHTKVGGGVAVQGTDVPL